MGRPRKKPIAKAEQSESIGLGDTIAKITEKTGIDKLVKFVAGEDCGCDERRAKFNKFWRYKQPKCLEESEYQFLSQLIENKVFKIDVQTRNQIFAIYNRVFNTVKKPTSCSTCIKSIMNDLTIIYNEYK